MEGERSLPIKQDQEINPMKKKNTAVLAHTEEAENKVLCAVIGIDLQGNRIWRFSAGIVEWRTG
jgi:hypothetical protein